MRTIRTPAKAVKDVTMVAKPGTAPAAVRPPKVSLQPPQINPASQRNYGKAAQSIQQPQIAPPTGLPGQGL